MKWLTDLVRLSVVGACLIGAYLAYQLFNGARNAGLDSVVLHVFLGFSAFFLLCVGLCVVPAILVSFGDPFKLFTPRNAQAPDQRGGFSPSDGSSEKQTHLNTPVDT